MKTRTATAPVLLSLAICACSGPPDLQTSRSVFHNPYAELEIANGPVGPECDESLGNRRECLIEALVISRDGRFALDGNGNVIRLSRAQRRRVQEREDAIEAKADLLKSLENGTPLPPDSPALPDSKR